jgi:hypothetical protein
MPAGWPFFAWIEASETTFEPEHMRWDENVFSFALAQEEGDPASLTIVARRPRNVGGDPIGLLGPGRKIWCWFALDCGPDLIRFRGRLVGVPTSIFEELVTLEFVARPFDVVAQKEALADTLRVLPYYDELLIDPARRTDPEVVLEGYTKVWHYDRETHVLSVSDEIAGEDGLVEFDGASEGGKVLWDGLGLTLTSGPLTRVDVNAEFTWTQTAIGNVDLTDYLTENWPNEPEYATAGTITSFSFGADNWPKNGAGLGTGWTVAEATSVEVYDLEVKTISDSKQITLKWWDGETTNIQHSSSRSYLTRTPPGSIGFPNIMTNREVHTKWSSDGDGGQYVSSHSVSTSVVSSVLPLHHVKPTLLAAYTAGRQCTERVAFSLFADVQSVLTDPEDGEALRIDDIRSVNLSEPIGGVVPIGDPRRRSYIATERGNRSLEHLIVLARAHLMKRARVVEITFAPKLERMPEITLRKNVFLIEPRVGEALGKVIGYSLALDGSDGRINCEVSIGCAIGRGGSAVASGGDPTYASVEYTGADYQQFTGRTVLFPDASVGYQPPNAAPNDDGIDFLSALRAEDVIETGLVVENPPATQREVLSEDAGWSFSVDMPIINLPGLRPTDEQAQAIVAERAESINNLLKEVETRATFKLKSMSREFMTPYELQVTDLNIPAGYDLEAA